MFELLLRFKIIATLFGIIVFPLCSNAQNGIPANAGARGMAMGNATVAFSDINCLFSNPGGLAGIDKTEAIVFGEQRFAIADIRFAAAGLIYPVKSGTFGLSIQYFGFESYNEQRVGFAYARKLLNNLSIGAQFNYLNFRIPEYGNKGLISAEIGLRSQIFKELALAVHIANPVPLEIVENEELPTIFKIGTAYTPSEKVLITLEVEKDLEFKEIVKAGLEYQFVESFYARIGIATNPTLLSFGMGLNLKKGLVIDAASSYHQTLGFSPGLSLRFRF